jgi:phospholipid/cholesterol/gamma-HCH transport system substrate-binding protein
MADAAVAFRGRGVDLNAAIGNLDPFAERADDLLRILDSQRLAVKKLLADGGATFDAISKQPGELRSLIQNTESVFSTTAARDTEIREIFQALPTFQDEARLTLERLDTFATDTNPLITQLRPVARQLSGTLIALKRLAPEAERFFHGLRPVIQRAQSGFGSLRVLLDDQLPPFLGRLDPYFNQLIPIVDTVNRYKGEVTSFLGNTSAALNAGSTPNGGTRLIKYLRAASPLGPGVLGSPPSPYKSSRLNAYVKAGGYTKLSQGLDSFFTANCTGGRTATLQQGDFSNDLYDRVQIYAMGGAGITNTDDVPAPPCRQQGTQSSIGGPPNQDTDYLHVNPEG